MNPWVRRLPWLAVVGLWLWLPIDYHITGGGFDNPAILPGSAREWLVPAGGTTDPQMWEELKDMEEVEVRDENDSLLFRGTPEALKVYLAGQPKLPASGPLLPTIGGEHGP